MKRGKQERHRLRNIFPDISAPSHGQCQFVRVNFKNYDGPCLHKTWVFSFLDELNSEAFLLHIWFYSNLSEILKPGCIISDTNMT